MYVCVCECVCVSMCVYTIQYTCSNSSVYLSAMRHFIQEQVCFLNTFLYHKNTNIIANSSSNTLFSIEYRTLYTVHCTKYHKLALIHPSRPTQFHSTFQFPVTIFSTWYKLSLTFSIPHLYVPFICRL